jgi:hypothetical protein
VDTHLWKFLRLRPASFPTIRLSQFAGLMHRRIPLLATLLQCRSLQETEQLLRVPASEYWNTHYLFGKCAPESEKWLGSQTVSMLVLNVLVPFLHTYGTFKDHGNALKLADRLLQDTAREYNRIISGWEEYGIAPGDAFESQALIQLYKAYCKQNRCLDCQIGAGIIRQALHEEQ